MTTKWQFDREFLIKTINEGQLILKDPKTHKQQKPLIQADINDFNNFLNNNFNSSQNDTSTPPKDIEKLKSYILRKMQNQYKTLGEDVIRWAITLSAENIFDITGTTKNFKKKKSAISIEEQAELTLKNYKEHSKLYYEIAKHIIKIENPSQIQLITKSKKPASYCRHNFINHIPFIIINENDESWALNHEVQHAIEEIINYETPYFYDELGATYFELLFSDELYKHQGKISMNEYKDKIITTDRLIATNAIYFITMLEFARKNFDITTNDFINAFSQNYGINPKKTIKLLRNQIATDSIDEDINYVFSYLKAIELREKTTERKIDSAEILEPYINQQNFHFNIPEDKNKPYERFIEEVKAKTKK